MLGPGGRLWVPDARNARMSIFDPAAGIVRSHPMRTMSRGFIWQGAVGEDGRVHKPDYGYVDGEPWQMYRLYDSTMTQLDSVPLEKGSSGPDTDPPGAFYIDFGGGSWGFYGVPFYAQGGRLMDPRGVFWSTTEGDPAYRIARWAPGGDTTLVIEVRRPPVPVSAAERDSALGQIQGSLQERGVTPKLDESKVPATKPAVAGLFLAESGDLWVRVATPADSLLTYDVFDRDGHPLGTAVTSLALLRWVRPTVRGDRFWAVVTDELDVPYVVRARIVPVSSGSRL
jgi:hypothetical protein